MAWYSLTGFRQGIMEFFLVLSDFFQKCIRVFPILMKGFMTTLELSLTAIILGTLLGLFIALMKISKNKYLSRTAGFYIWVLRGTPLLLQLFFVYFVLPKIGIIISQFASALIAFTFNVSAYMSEIIRAGIQSIDRGQMEAAKALGMTYLQAMRRIIIPQALRRMIPPSSNEFSAIIKDTSLVSFIALSDIMKLTKDIFSGSYGALLFQAALVSAILYLVLTTSITFVFEKLEKRLSLRE